MRYLVAIATAVVVLFLLGTMGFGDWPRPWGSLSRGAVGGLVCIAVLIVWEQVSPSPNRDGSTSGGAADGNGDPGETPREERD